jgi:hypothetical protein
MADLDDVVTFGTIDYANKMTERTSASFDIEEQPHSTVRIGGLSLISSMSMTSGGQGAERTQL